MVKRGLSIQWEGLLLNGGCVPALAQTFIYMDLMLAAMVADVGENGFRFKSACGGRRGSTCKSLLGVRRAHVLNVLRDKLAFPAVREAVPRDASRSRHTNSDRHEETYTFPASPKHVRGAWVDL